MKLVFVMPVDKFKLVLEQNVRLSSELAELIDEDMTAMNSEIRKYDLRKKGYKIL